MNSNLNPYEFDQSINMLTVRWTPDAPNDYSEADLRAMIDNISTVISIMSVGINAISCLNAEIEDSQCTIDMMFNHHIIIYGIPVTGEQLVTIINHSSDISYIEMAISHCHNCIKEITEELMNISNP